jgi:hypothetical protein
MNDVAVGPAWHGMLLIASIEASTLIPNQMPQAQAPTPRPQAMRRQPWHKTPNSLETQPIV